MQRIPGVLRLYDPAPGHALPILVDSPHSGSHYPADFKFICDKTALERYEDRAVDQLLANFPALGATMLCSEVARSYVDLNRKVNDFDGKQIFPHEFPFQPDPDYALRGIGVVWETVNGHFIYANRITPAEFEARIKNFYEPYYATLHQRAAKLKKKFGKFWHLNFHSMNKAMEAEVIIGTLDGQSCSDDFLCCVENAFHDCGLKNILKDTHYKGANLTQLFGDPKNNSESIQIEINKGLYLQDDLLTIDQPKFKKLQAQLEGVFKIIGCYAMEQIQMLKISAKDSLSAASRPSIDALTPSAAREVTP